MSLLAEIDAALDRLKRPGAPNLRRDEQVRLLSQAALALRPAEHRGTRSAPDLGPALLAMAGMGRIGDPIALGRALAPEQRPTAQRSLGIARLTALVGAELVARRGPYWIITAHGVDAARAFNDRPEATAA